MNNKILMLTNLAFLSMAVFFGCEYFKKEETKPDIRPTPECSTCGDDMGVTLGGIKATTARGMANNYIANQLAHINAGGLQNDARSVWFPLDTIKRLLYEIESKTCRSGCNDKAYGVRIYYAAYPPILPESNNTDLTNVPPTYRSYHTVFFVPTYTDATSGGPVDFDPWHMNGCTPKTFRQIMSSSDSLEKSLIIPAVEYSTQMFFRTTNGGTSTNTVQNHGGLCPPICQPPNGTAF
jgi:hypothetical protein